MRILADQAGNLLNIDGLSVDVGIARETVYDYLMLLENSYIIALLRPYFKNLKSELVKIVITLDKKTTKKKDINVIYPWEISN